MQMFLPCLMWVSERVRSRHLLKLTSFNMHFSEFIFYMFFSHQGLVNNFGHPFLFDRSSSCLFFFFFCILTICLSDVLHTAFPQAPVPPPFVKDFCFNKIFTTLGKTRQALLFYSKNNPFMLTSCDAENLYIYACMSYCILCVWSFVIVSKRGLSAKKQHT